MTGGLCVKAVRWPGAGLAFVWALTCLAFGGGALAEPVSLHGLQLITLADDDPGFADPGFDDSGWDQIPVPSSLRAAGVERRGDVFWYRIHFRMPEGWPSDSPAIRLGILDRADQTFLNGTLIGQTGQIGPRLSDWHVYPLMQPRLYPFAPSLLRPGADNVLAIRAAREPYIDDGGLLTGPVALVDLAEALPGYLAERQRFAAANFTLFGLELVLMIGVGVAAAIWWRVRAVRLFLLVYLPYFLATLERRDVLDAVGLVHPGLQFAANVIGALCVPPLLAFVAEIVGHRIGHFGRAVQVGLVGALISVPQTGVPVLDWWAIESALIWHLVFLVALLLMVTWSLRAWLAGNPMAFALLLGLFCFFVTMVGDILLPVSYFEGQFGLRLAEIGLVVLFMSFAAVAAQSVMAIGQVLLRAQADVLTAQTDERARLARDMHDGLGQWLTAIKLKLQTVAAGAKQAPPKNSDLSELVGDVSTAIDDMRRISHDLSPALLENQGLAAAMQSQADRVAQGSGLVIDIVRDSPILLPAERATHVYRIFQEALNNAIAHGRSSRITATLMQTGTHLTMKVQDNGTGISGPDAPDKTDGLGLKSMHNRARVLGGTLELSGNRTGTLLVLRIPSAAP